MRLWGSLGNKDVSLNVVGLYYSSYSSSLFKIYLLALKIFKENLMCKESFACEGFVCRHADIGDLKSS